MDARLIKTKNIDLVLRSLLKNESCSQNELAHNTGLSIPSVGKILKELIEKGDVLEVTIGESSGGRKPILYSLDMSKYMVGVFYIEKDQSSLTLKTPFHELILSVELKNITDGIDSLKNNLQELVEQIKDNGIDVELIRSWAIIVPGIISLENNEIIYSKPLNLKHVSVNSDLFLHKVVNNIYVFQDSDAYLLGYKPLKMNNRTAFLLLHEGLGFSLINNNELMKEQVGGLEIGHTIFIDSKGRLTKLGDIFRNKQIIIKGEDEATRKKALAVCLINIINLFNPDLLLVGGDNVNDLMDDKLINSVEEEALLPYMEATEIKEISCSRTGAIRGVIDYINNKAFQVE
ncbi:ROK family transcriptional regulator [Enterococcus massiliensis]|uniref:ROK family transcriptional regulator n=1 Tax=Enterococcus massiliensis TaxID=1640685 RepID=UPI00065E92FB|nr:winged helix-turn-helix transcriptional regulator [Enterococcus massiliensis]